MNGNFNGKQIIYAALTLLGVVWPWYHNFQFFKTNSATDVMGFIEAANVNAAASSLAADLTVGCAAFLVWAVIEGRRLNMRHLWVYFVLTFGVAFAFAFPLFLFMRERVLSDQQSESQATDAA